MEQKQKAEGHFVNFVLLKEAVWDKEEFMRLLKEEWQVEEEENPQGDAEKDIAKEEDAVCFYSQGCMISVALMPAAIPDGEAEYHAGRNYMWQDAEKTVKQHQAHLLVIVMNLGAGALEAGKMLTKAVSVCCKQAGALGVYANETVYQPEQYLQFASILKESQFPIFNLVWFGLYPGKGGLCACTCGMDAFGYDEMEIIDSNAQPSEILDFLSGVAAYVIVENVTLQNGETIGFSAEQKISITKSQGIAVEGESLKLGF